jgi:predicted acetyltransferase
VLDVTDEICPWNEGRFVLEVADDGTAQVDGPLPADGPRPVGAPLPAADLSLDVSMLAAIYLGGIRPSLLVAAGRAGETSHAGTARADVLFSSEAEPYCSFGF